jgi:NAD(P)H-dependent flavin oxidoreductase YrpB (nitropropane dioxygenase family)
MLTTAFTELVGCRLPLRQAPMGGVTTPELVAAVADAGAVGMVPAQMLPAEALAALLDDLAGRSARETTGAVAAMVHDAGQGVGATTRVRPAAEVVTELAAGAERLLRRWA